MADESFQARPPFRIVRGRRTADALPSACALQASPSQGSEPPESLALARSLSGLRLRKAHVSRFEICAASAEEQRNSCLCSLSFIHGGEGGAQELRSFRLWPRLHSRSCRFARGPPQLSPVVDTLLLHVAYLALEKLASSFGLCGRVPGTNLRHPPLVQDAYSLQKKPLGEGSFGSAFRATCKSSPAQFQTGKLPLAAGARSDCCASCSRLKFVKGWWKSGRGRDV